MKIQWFLPSLVGFLWATAPALAGELESLQFEPSQNVLQFTTDEDVQPRAQLVPDPTRLVIDLPGTTVGPVPSSQAVGGAVQQVRVGQFDANTTRIVLELAPGYVMDPQQIRFRGISPTNWTVQLPDLEYAGSTTTPAPLASSSPFPTQSSPSPSYIDRPTPALSSPTASSFASPSPISSGVAAPSPAPTPAPAPIAPVVSTPAPAPAVVDETTTQIDGLRITDDGLFVRTSGARAEIETERSRDRRTITLTVENAVLSPQFTEREQAIAQYDIEQMQFTQTDEAEPTVEIILTVDRDSPDWRATTSGLGGIVLLPQESATPIASSRSNRDRGDRDRDRDNERAQDRNRDRDSARAEQMAASRSTRNSPPVSSPNAAAPPPANSSSLPVATIQGVALDASETQLLIQSDRAVSYVGQWQSGMYQVTLSPAQLADRVSGPELNTDSPLLRVRLRQDDEDTVLITIQPAAGVRFGNLNAASPQLLTLGVERAQPVLTPPLPSNTADRWTLPPSSSMGSLPSIRNERLLVVIDPGHGGADVGAVGIGDLYEANVVLAISQQVGAFLQQQGVQVVMTRSDDQEIDLEPRVQMAEQSNATLFVSIHANSMGMDRPDVNGTETYYYSSGEALAQVIQSSIVNNLGVNDRGIRQARFYVLRRTSMPAVLVETGYVTGEEDAPRLANATFQTQMAYAIAQGILQYIQQNAASLP